MITLEAVALAINEKLNEILPDIPIQSTDISEGFERPSLFTEFEESTRAGYSAGATERNIPVVIYYFPKDRYKHRIELLRVQETLEQAFSGQFTISDGFVVYPETVCDKVDGVLQCRFEIYFIEAAQEEAGELMDSLNLELQKEE
ncbi:hypothetical protein P4H27_10000 [Paenibacillus taichungensis]|uniref:phage tail terminator family protein n=1 Tax=Paenibacillus taichungensis TaxID=484184 RepID=UPI002DB8CBE5|nr:hypothetical protein [Paenibacillus taichungensis]MEC0107268.1 hypothetical protein [Paenibacillus taichungensis]MEC0194800.1 hypothetical protein [Paenibacillus taichungensis]